MFFESTECLRNVENYKLDVLKANVSETGIREVCLFNEIPNYHVTVNSVCDFMHDVTEGVARYDMALIITHLIKDKYFTLECLNNRIMLFHNSLSLYSYIIICQWSFFLYITRELQVFE